MTGFNWIVTCLPDAEVVDITYCLDRLIILERSRWSWCMLAPTTLSDVVTCSWRENITRQKVKGQESRVAFSELLPIPSTGGTGQAQIGEGRSMHG